MGRREMEDRYRKMSKMGVRNIDGFNARVAEASARGEVITRSVQTGSTARPGEAISKGGDEPRSIARYRVIVDEMADLVYWWGARRDRGRHPAGLGQMGARGRRLPDYGTLRPSVDVITGTIKANFPTRISFQVTSKIDSRTIWARWARICSRTGRRGLHGRWRAHYPRARAFRL